MRAAAVLILDDETVVANVIAAAAFRCGLHPLVTSEASAFFEVLEAERPARVVLDLAIPDVDGIEILRRLGERNCPAGIAIVSGLGRSVLAAAARLAVEQGLDLLGTVAKPFRIEPLMAVLTRTPRVVLGRRDPDPAPLPHTICPGSLAEAMAQGALGVVYQPKIACRTGALVGFEALAQWRGTDGRLVPTEQFVALAEQSSLIEQLTEHVLSQALDWFGPLPDHLSLAVNLSARSLGDHALVERLLEACAKVGVDPVRVVIEITETATMVDPVASLDILTRLRVHGFRVSIDDFGVGHATFAQLARMPFSEIKIDRSFVRDLDLIEEHRCIVRALVGLGQSLGLTVTAEGVESATTLGLLAEMGCDHAQGFHVAPPLEATAAQALAGGRLKRGRMA